MCVGIVGLRVETSLRVGWRTRLRAEGLAGDHDGARLASGEHPTKKPTANDNTQHGQQDNDHDGHNDVPGLEMVTHTKRSVLVTIGIAHTNSIGTMRESIVAYLASTKTVQHTFGHTSGRRGVRLPVEMTLVGHGQGQHRHQGERHKH